MCAGGLRVGQHMCLLLLAALAGNEGECQSFSSRSERPPRSLLYLECKTPSERRKKKHTHRRWRGHTQSLFVSPGTHRANKVKTRHSRLDGAGTECVFLKCFPSTSTCNFSCAQITVCARITLQHLLKGMLTGAADILSEKLQWRVVGMKHRFWS